MPGEEYLHRIEARVPGFGGMYYDTNGDLVIVLKDLRLAAAARAVVLPYLPDGGRHRRADPQAPPLAVRVRQGQYGFAELNEYWDRINPVVFGIPGVLATDVDEELNRVQVYVRSPTAAQAVYRAIAHVPVPGDAVHISECDPTAIYCDDGSINPSVEELGPAPLEPTDTAAPADAEVAPDDLPNNNLQPETGGNLTSYEHVLRGGLKITYRAPRTRGESTCTLGFTALLNGGKIYVTASHCSPAMGSPASPNSSYAEAYYFQPKQGSGNGNYIGWEWWDPAFQPPSYWQARGVTQCTGSYYCRWSDAVAVAAPHSYRAFGLGYIARALPGSTQIDLRSPSVSILGKAHTRYVKGTRMEVVGAVSGWKSGNMGDTCIAGPVYYSNGRSNHLMCQDVVFFSTSPGDSGAPVFYYDGLYATLYGVLSGGTATYGIKISHMSNIEADLGTLRVN